MTSPEELQRLALDAELEGTPYRAIGHLGQGGMGAVFEVEHRSLRRRLVMKVLREPNRPDLEDRLRLEAQALAQLNHPHLLAVVDYGHTPSGRPYLVSERLYGRTLKEELGPTGALAVADAVRYVSEALSALGVAHRAGVVHRDVKLDNLFLCDANEAGPRRIKVIDFGIAKLVGAEGGTAPVNLAPLEVPTAEGMMVGTPSFMAPEQITNQPVDQRADIYGVGVVLYRLLAGRNPFICRDLLEYAAAHASEIPQPPSRFASVPAALDAVVLRALEKDPRRRFGDTAEMIAALAPFLSPAAAAMPAPRPTQATTVMAQPQPPPAQELPAPAAPPPVAFVPRGPGTIRMESPAQPLPAAATRPMMPSSPHQAAWWLEPSPAALPAPPPPHAPVERDQTVVRVAIVVAVVSIIAIVCFALVLLGVIG